MFLSESYVMTEGSNVSADPMYGMELIQEAVESFNDLSMKMIKLEHTAIMNEDAELLNEGVREFGRKVVDWIKVTARKFVEYLERVRVQWTQLVSAISTKFLNKNVIEELKRGITKKVTVKLPIKKFNKAIDVVSVWQSAADIERSALAFLQNLNSDAFSNISGVSKDAGTSTLKSVSGKDKQKDVKSSVKQAFGKTHLYSVIWDFKDMPETEEEVTLTSTLVNTALNFLKRRPIATKNIQIFKSGFTKICNAALSKADKGATLAKDVVTSAQRLMNQTIIETNKCTTYAIRICNGAKREGASDIDMDDARENARKNRGTYHEYDTKQAPNKNVNTLSESILDRFA